MPKDCVFCEIVGGAEHHVVYRDDRTVAFLDRAPVSKGHTLVVTTAHYEAFDEVPDEALGPLFATAKRVSIALQRSLGAQGSLTVTNTRISQSVPHVHVHVVPRRKGDGLFSPGRGFWIRQRYADGEAEAVAATLRAALTR